MMSLDSHFAGGLSNKKALHTTIFSDTSNLGDGGQNKKTKTKGDTVGKTQ